jgi:hypothetical protein
MLDGCPRDLWQLSLMILQGAFICLRQTNMKKLPRPLILNGYPTNLAAEPLEVTHRGVFTALGRLVTILHADN